jgi:hypothetical protein
MRGCGDDILRYGTAGFAILVGLVAVVLSLVARRSLLEAAVTAVSSEQAGGLGRIG